MLKYNELSIFFIKLHTHTTYLSIVGKCRLLMFDSNGLGMGRKRDGGVGVFTMGSVPFRAFRIEFGVWNSFAMAVTLVDAVTIIFVVRLLIAGFDKWLSDDVDVDVVADVVAVAAAVIVESIVALIAVTTTASAAAAVIVVIGIEFIFH